MPLPDTTLLTPMHPTAEPSRPRAAGTAAAPLDTTALPDTTLERLEAAAELLTRVDRKYLVPMTAAQELVDGLARRAHVLTIDGRRRFSYASTYFDTPDLEAYMLAAHKRRHRFKIRTRTYLDSDLCFLEVKTCGARETTIKTRLPYDPGEGDRLTDTGRAFVAEQLASSRITDAPTAREIAESLIPVLGTTYERTTFHLPEDGARATIDTALTWRRLTRSTWRTAPTPGMGVLRTRAAGPARDLPAAAPARRTALLAPSRRGPAAGPGEPVVLGGYAVVETKNPAAPSPTDRLLWALGHRPARLSKYATGMALLHPGLPANRWHRTLTRELAGLTTPANITRAA